MRSAHARTVRDVTIDRSSGRGAADYEMESLPRLSLWLIAWQGKPEGPCFGSPSLRLPLPDSPSRIPVVLHETWDGECAERPHDLGWSDHALFLRAATAGPTRQPYDRGALLGTRREHMPPRDRNSAKQK